MRALLLIALSLGFLLHAGLLLTRDVNPFALGLFAYALVPYAVAALLGFFRRTAAAAIGFAAGALAGDLYTRYFVFVERPGSMAGYMFLAMPFWNLLLLGPIGAFLAWICVWFIRRRSGEGAAQESR